MFKRALALTLLAAVAGCGPQANEWKTAPDPEVVNFPLDQAEVVTQELVAPPFLPEHEQVASSPPKVVEITMEIIEQEV